MLEGIGIAFGLIFVHQSARRFSKQQNKVIRHRDQKVMVAYAKRMRRHKIKMQRSELPVGTHLLLSGMLLTINGVVYDIGFPGWMTNLVPKESERSVRPKLARRANSMKRERDARMQNLSPGWWLKRPKEEGSDVPAMERLVGRLHIVAVPSKFSVNQVVLQSHWDVVEDKEKSCPRTSVAKEFLTTQLGQRDNRVTRQGGPRRPS